ncbi:hypothetical protein [Vibrio jasicida]|uniref:hypothetical protein n=1 Tax=Vibrio jasicida TaxID=766224 RepID=UPI0040695519
MSKHEFSSEEAKAAQLKSASARSENARRRAELRALAKQVSLNEVLSQNELDINLTNEQKLEIKMYFLKAVLAPLALDAQRHNHKLIEMLMQSELDEILREQPSKQDINLTGNKMSVYEAIRAGVIDEQRISIDDVNTLRGFVQ